MQFTYGEGIQNYFNDAPIDVGLKSNGGNPVTPVTGEALPIFGMVIALDHTWNDTWSTGGLLLARRRDQQRSAVGGRLQERPVLRGEPAEALRARTC